jgi:hypothetical protein
VAADISKGNSSFIFSGQEVYKIGKMGSVAGIHKQDPGSGCWKEGWVSQQGGAGGGQGVQID